MTTCRPFLAFALERPCFVLSLIIGATTAPLSLGETGDQLPHGLLRTESIIELMPCIWSTMVRTCLPFVIIHHHSELHPTPESIPTRSTSLALHSSLRSESLPLKNPFSRLSTTGTTCSFRAERSFFPNLDDGRNCEALATRAVHAHGAGHLEGDLLDMQQCLPGVQSWCGH